MLTFGKSLAQLHATAPQSVMEMVQKAGCAHIARLAVSWSSYEAVRKGRRGNELSTSPPGFFPTWLHRRGLERRIDYTFRGRRA